MATMKYLLAALLITFSCVHGGITYYQGRFVDPEDLALADADTHFRFACEAYHYHDWKQAIRHFHIISVNFPEKPYYDLSRYYLGVSYFYYGEYEFANEAFTNYLKGTNHPEFIESAIQYKYDIAQAFHSGAKRHIYGSKSLPAWLDAKELALDVYDEIITAFPCHSLAAHSLYWKGCLLWGNCEYRESVEAFNTLIRRFPHHELAPESYLLIARLYLDQAKKEFQNPDILALTELNLRKFQNDFPSEERIEEAQQYVQGVKETFAHGLYDTGLFFDRWKKSEASMLYFQTALKRYPDTAVAEHIRRRFARLGVEDEEFAYQMD